VGAPKIVKGITTAHYYATYTTYKCITTTTVVINPNAAACVIALQNLVDAIKLA
jgi:hypothetical protein